MRMIDTGTTTTGTYTYGYSNHCGNRLPCGICRLMMSQCPIVSGITVKPTWVGDTVNAESIKTGETKVVTE